MMPRRTTVRNIYSPSKMGARKALPRIAEEHVIPDLKLTPSVPRKKFQLNIKLNNALRLQYVEPAVHHSQSISFRLTPVAPKFPSFLDVKSKKVEVEVYYNPRLQEKIDRCEPKLHVDLSYCQIIDRDMMIVTNKLIIEKKCTDLWLYGNEITAKGISTLAASLTKNSTLKSLDLSFNQICDDGVRLLTTGLLPNQYSALRILYLSKNGISDDGAIYLSEMLQRNQTIKELWLSDNEIGNKGVKQLANALAYHNETLKLLSLSMNMFISDLCIEDLDKVFEHNETLKQFWVNNCNFTEYGKSRLRDKAKRKTKMQVEI